MDSPAWLDELPLSPSGPPWLAMGLTRCADDDWLAPDDLRPAELTERHRLLGERHGEVFGAQPDTEPAGAEVLALVRAWFVEYRPEVVLPPDPPGVHSLESAGRLTQEDLCLMVEHDGVPHLDAACLCFPSHWRLADKLGHPAAAIHDPVPRYSSELSARVDRYLTRLPPDVIGLRRNWSIHESPALFAPERPPPTTVRIAEVPDRLWLRSERQTLRRLPESGAVLFTIRVQQAPLGVLAARPDIAAALAGRIDAQPPELTEMNGLATHHAAVIAWLST